ncbi:cGMP-dependent protein kinase [Fasciolopsis buskii]|uniref:cGMP-dependent protein kinase n=1 Tax=Fasciolopsis buskii TaxID=27845 RepID=A0A8E0S1C2_9TREM|nr:cGMP-dependent protein kinase [Fasciolopsis buski]
MKAIITRYSHLQCILLTFHNPISDGTLEIWKDGQKLREIGRRTVLGELAILYNCQRTATVKASTACQLWAIDRKSFQTILRKKNIQRHRSRVAFLKSVPTFTKLPDGVLSQLADQLTEIKYQPNEYVIRQGARGDNFYIVCSGQVNVTIHPSDEQGQTDFTKEAKFVRTMGRGEWFGEKALKREQTRTANIIASEPDGATCLALDYESYHQLIGDLEIFSKQYSDAKIPESIAAKVDQEFANLKLEDLITVGTLGVGGFGRVVLFTKGTQFYEILYPVCLSVHSQTNKVKIKKDDSRSFALKRMKKHHIVQTRQQEHVLNERNILFETQSEFVVRRFSFLFSYHGRLWRTFKDEKYVYMLLDACLGGELWTLLRDQYFFTESTTQFYVACVVEALDYLHKRNIIFRDLKPENLILDTDGYCKLTDFGFSKKLPTATKTWTFCGTPEYMAPEIILNKGHDQAVDFWSLGILIYELLTGLPPFDSPDAMRTYSLILKGIEAIGFPPRIPRNAQNLIRKLCRYVSLRPIQIVNKFKKSIICHSNLSELNKRAFLPLFSRDNPSERLGYSKGGIRETELHVWFEGFDWIGLQKRSLKAPHQRSVQSPSDLRHFDKCPEDKEVPPDELSGWDANF